MLGTREEHSFGFEDGPDRKRLEALFACSGNWKKEPPARSW